MKSKFVFQLIYLVLYFLNKYTIRVNHCKLIKFDAHINLAGIFYKGLIYNN